MKRSDILSLAKNTASSWIDHNAPRLGASLAFYTLLSLAPLVIIVVAICGLFLSRTTAEQELLGQARQLVGYSGANTLRMLVDNATQAKTGLIASCIAIVTLMVGASGVFAELRDSLNSIWDAPPAVSDVKTFILRRLLTFGMVLALGFLLLVSLLVSAALGVIARYFFHFLPIGAAEVGEVMNFVFSLFAITVLFALIYKFIPDVPIAWKEVWIGAFVTAVLFSIGRALLAIYMATAAVGSTYGAAGSLVALVIWVYYSAQIFFFGAVFTRVYANWQRKGEPLEVPDAPGKSTAAIK